MVIQEILKKYRDEKNRIEINIDKVKNDLGSMIDKIVLYGAGSAGIAFLYYLRDAGIYPQYFADGNQSKWGTMCEGLSIIDYKDIVKTVGEDALVIITINTDGKNYCKSFDEALRAGGHSGVHKSLKECGCKNVIDYTYFRRCGDLFRGDKYNLPSCSDVNLMERHEKELCEVYELLADSTSREVFEKIVRFRMLDDSIEIPTESQDKQYFEYELFQKKENEIFVDCGAYNGISLNTFLKENCFQFKKYYGIEPDKNNFIKLKAYVSTLQEEIRNKIVLLDKAVYDAERTLHLYSLNGPGSFIADIGVEETVAVQIDNIVDMDGATYIKMNIEGSELNALKGAVNTIKQYKPRLAVAGYHKTWDLWEIPQFIYSLNSTYNIYLRSYMNHLSFVFYCV